MSDTGVSPRLMRSGSESSVSGAMPSPDISQLDLESLANDTRLCNSSMLSLVQAFSISHDDEEKLLKVHQHLGDMLKQIRFILRKYQFEQVTKKNIMDRAIIVQKFVMEMDYASDEYKSNARALKDELYLLVDRIATSLQTAFKSLLTGYETPKVEVTPEITIERSKVTSHYLKHLADFMEWRARLEIDYAQKLSRQAEKYRQILSSDPYLPLQSTFVTSLEKTHEFAESLTLCQRKIQSSCVENISVAKSSHDEKRKRLKAELKKSRDVYNETVQEMRNAEIKYRQAQEDHLKAQHKTREEEANLVGKSVPIAKVNKRQRQEEEALERLKLTERDYRQKIDVANKSQSEMAKQTTSTANQLQESICKIDEVIRSCGSNYFALQHSVLINFQSSLDSLRETALNYQPGRQLSEYVRDLHPHRTYAEEKPFQFNAPSVHKTTNYVSSSSEEDEAQHGGPSAAAAYFRQRSKVTKKSLFGMPLADAVRNGQNEKYKVPFVVSRLIKELDSRALKTKGLYRVNGVKHRVENLCSSFSKDSTTADMSQSSEHDISSVLKKYFHDLPAPLISHSIYQNLLDISQKVSSLRKNLAAQSVASGAITVTTTSKKTAIQEEIEAQYAKLCEKLIQLETVNYTTLKLVIQHLTRVAKNEEHNMMGPKNLGTVFGPTLMRAPDDKGPMGCLIDVQDQSRLVEIMITHCDICFSS